MAAWPNTLAVDWTVEDGELEVRGAPAIAIVGCLSLAVELRKEVFDSKKVLRQEVEGKLNYLVSARPTAVNMKMATEELITLVNLIDKDDSIKPEEMKAKFIAAIEAMLEKDVADNHAIGDAGARAILSHAPDDYLTRVLTHCNTGSLATAGYGTALGVIRNLHTRKRLAGLWDVGETLQGQLRSSQAPGLEDWGHREVFRIKTASASKGVPCGIPESFSYTCLPGGPKRDPHSRVLT
uniref:(California timema) hypothetical protein n=1 Tax=Timema californicum TaxID=61474 RepID=A0A7R9PDA7_TIMCA|nr:unnamed protein product [Timema californicum]